MTRREDAGQWADRLLGAVYRSTRTLPPAKKKAERPMLIVDACEPREKQCPDCGALHFVHRACPPPIREFKR